MSVFEGDGWMHGITYKAIEDATNNIGIVALVAMRKESSPGFKEVSSKQSKSCIT